MNWGYKILLVILVFIGAMATMVTIAMRQHNEMMDEQYYVRELKHQDLINAHHNLEALTQQVKITNHNGSVSIQFPASAIGNITESSIAFIRPSGKSKDRTILLSPDKNGKQNISGAILSKGLYRVRISWKNNNIPYYSEQAFFYN